MKHLLFTALVLTIINFSAIRTFTQKDISPCIVNSLIGDTLSLDEREYYKLFPQFDEFQWAVFYLNLDSTLNANVKYIMDGITKDTLIEKYKKLKSLNYHIYARNALENRPPDTFHSFPEDSKYKKGSEVCAYMNDGRETSGELLSVRVNSILLFNSDCDARLLKPECINQIKANEINKLVIEGNSNLGLGIGLGLLAAVVVGATVFQSYNDGSFLWARDAILPTILSTVGCITVGVSIGILTSTPDEVINIYSKNDIRGLSYYSRYPEKEPNELQTVK